ncbi:MAG: hypothetical protein ACYC35_12625 [Pirellulales bacterium]
MIAFAKPVPQTKAPAPAWHAGFLAMLPDIRERASKAFSRLSPRTRDDLVHEVIAAALVAYVRLVELDKANAAYAVTLARYAVAHVSVGRAVGTSMNSNDVSSRYGQLKNKITVERLDRFDQQTGEWIEAVAEDTRTPVPDQAAFRVDFSAWLREQSPRNRRVAIALARGERTMEVASKFGLTRGRVSQLRRELHDSWLAFHGEALAPDASGAVETERELAAAC